MTDTDARVHAWRVDPAQYARQERRRGRRHAFERVDPATTALVVLDMVAFFFDENPYCRGIVPNINELAAAVRSAGGVVAWVLPAADDELSPVKVEFLGEEVAALFNGSAGQGPLRDRLVPALAVRDADLLVEKWAASAFFPGRCDLDRHLRERGIETVIIAGTVTNVCCESSARDAATLGYRVIFVADATAAVDDASHNATLHTIYRTFGDVRSTEEVAELIRVDV